MKDIIDISLKLNEDTPIYPGNPSVDITPQPEGNSLISKISFGSHSGTHIDTPRHVFEDGKGLEAFNLDQMVGKARVLDMTDIDSAIKVNDLKEKNIKEDDRLLVKTKNSERGYNEFYDDFVYLDGDAAEYLKEKNIKFYGTDYLSIKEKGSEDNRAHTELLGNDIVIAEGLNLDSVDSGEYELVILPLKFDKIDGAPARAILIDKY